MMDKTYDIGGKKFSQRKLVLGQINQLTSLIGGELWPTGADMQTLLGMFGGKIPRAMAIVLLEEDQVTGKSGPDIAAYLRKRDIKALAEEIEFNLDPELIPEVIEDFFDCNPMSSLIKRFGAMAETIKGKMPALPTPSGQSSASSAEETSSSGTPSSGDSPSKKASPTSSTGSGKSSSGKPSSGS